MILTFDFHWNKEKWWPKLSTIFAESLTSPRIASIVKASVMLNLGKVAYYMNESNPYYQSIKDILFELSSFDNILVSEPACYSLVNVALGHPELVIIFSSIIFSFSVQHSKICIIVSK